MQYPIIIRPRRKLVSRIIIAAFVCLFVLAAVSADAAAESGQLQPSEWLNITSIPEGAKYYKTCDAVQGFALITKAAFSLPAPKAADRNRRRVQTDRNPERF